jgi:hypothetical protein
MNPIFSLPILARSCIFDPIKRSFPQGVRFRGPVADYLIKMKLTLTAFLLGAALLGAQSKSAATKSAAPRPASSGLATSQATSAQEDKVIEGSIRGKLAKSKIGRDGFTVHVQGGVAFWEGATGIVQHKGAATRMAKSSGAKRVVNNIKVSDEAKEKAAGNLEQGRRRARVKRSDSRSQ